MFPPKPKLKSDRPRKKEVFGLTESVLSALKSDFPINELSRDLMDIHILSKFHDGKSIHREFTEFTRLANEASSLGLSNITSFVKNRLLKQPACLRDTNGSHRSHDFHIIRLTINVIGHSFYATFCRFLLLQRTKTWLWISKKY